MARLDFPDTSRLPRSGHPRAQGEPVNLDAHATVSDRVPWDCPGAREIGFTLPERYNASEVLFHNLAAGRDASPAVIGPGGVRSYAQLAADAARWGNAFASLGLSRGDRILLMLDDTPFYPAAFFGAVHAGFVPILINVLTPPDLLRFYLEDSGARTAVVEAEFYDHFEAACGRRTQLKTLIVVNGQPSTASRGVDVKTAPKIAAQALQDYVKQKLAPYKYPRLVQLLARAAENRNGQDRSAGAAHRGGQCPARRHSRRLTVSQTDGRAAAASRSGAARRCGMKNLRAKNLELAGIELVLPTVLCIDGRAAKGARKTLTIGYAAGYVDSIVGPLAAEWLTRQFHRRYCEHGRGAEGDLAAEAFYDKLASEFRRDAPFLAAIVSTHHAIRFGDPCVANAAATSHEVAQHRTPGDALSRFIRGAGLIRWIFAGPVRAFINAKAGAAQLAFEPLPGGIELIGIDKPDASSARICKHANEAVAWYGFGVPVRDPAEIVLMLRNEISEPRHAENYARRAAHV
jgi:hypothetical protein